MREQQAENEEVMELTDIDWRNQKLVGGEMRRRRERMGLTQAQTAEKMGPGYSAELVAQYEDGSVRMEIGPFFSMLAALDMTPNEVVPEHLRAELFARNGYEKLDEKSRKAVDGVIEAILSGRRTP